MLGGRHLGIFSGAVRLSAFSFDAFLLQTDEVDYYTSRKRRMDILCPSGPGVYITSHQRPTVRDDPSFNRIPYFEDTMKAALVTLWLTHLPFHPSCFLGYGAAILSGRYDLEVMDLNAEIYYGHREKLHQILATMEKSQVVSDDLLTPLYNEIETYIEGHYASVNWKKYPLVYVTPPSWFPMVPADAVLRLSRAITRISPHTKVFFYGNSLGSWTKEEQLKKHGVRTVHLNDLFALSGTAKPVRYDLLPNPMYGHRGKYLFDMLPFTLKHGCSWGRCRFCSLSRGWNSGYLERSIKPVIKELEAIIERYDPALFVCRDHTLNGHNLIEFCSCFERFKTQWCGQSRADLSGKKIEALRKSGCRGIFFGLESGSDTMLQAMNKGITSKQMSDFIKRLHGNGILAAPSLFIGAPGEDRADFEKTIQFLVHHRRYFDLVNIYPFMATPASEYSSKKKQPDANTLIRILQFIRTSEDLGLKVCLGEQSIEYTLFNRILTGGFPCIEEKCFH